MKLYTKIRGHIAPTADVRWSGDITGDIIKIIYEGLTSIDGDFDAEHERCRLHELLDHDYALSIYGYTAAQSNITHHSSSSYIASKWADAAAELAAKEAEYKIVQEERKQKERIKALEEQHKKELEIQQSELECLLAEKDVEAARARPESYNREIAQTGDAQSV